MYNNKVGLHKRQKDYKVGDLRTISLDVTNLCNMECKHCYAESFKGCHNIELDVLERFFNDAYSLGAYHYVLHGGEAILEFDRLAAIIQMIYPEETYITVVSNGWAMDVSTIHKLKILGVDKICFSLDSGIEEEHDANRRPGSYSKVLTAIENVKQEGLHVAISTVVTRDNWNSVGSRKLLEIATKLGVRVDLQVAMPVGKWDGEKDIRITSEIAADIVDIYQNRLMPDGTRSVSRDVFWSGGYRCPAGRDFMAITASGEMLPCNFCQYSLGNIKDVPLKQARNALMESKWFQGTHPVCLLGEDDEFFDLFVAPNVDKAKPLDAYKLFNLKRENNG